jgi:hypothetical protein
MDSIFGLLDSTGQTYENAPALNSPSNNDPIAIGPWSGPVDIYGQPLGSSFSTSIPDSANNTKLNDAAGPFAQTLSSLLNWNLAKDKLQAQTQLAQTTRLYPYGVNPLTGAPNAAPATAATNNLLKFALIGALILFGLKAAKAV